MLCMAFFGERVSFDWKGWTMKKKISRNILKNAGTIDRVILEENVPGSQMYDIFPSDVIFDDNIFTRNFDEP